MWDKASLKIHVLTFRSPRISIYEKSNELAIFRGLIEIYREIYFHGLIYGPQNYLSSKICSPTVPHPVCNNIDDNITICKICISTQFCWIQMASINTCISFAIFILVCLLINITKPMHVFTLAITLGFSRNECLCMLYK